MQTCPGTALRLDRGPASRAPPQAWHCGRNVHRHPRGLAPGHPARQGQEGRASSSRRFAGWPAASWAATRLATPRRVASCGQVRDGTSVLGANVGQFRDGPASPSCHPPSAPRHRPRRPLRHPWLARPHQALRPGPPRPPSMTTTTRAARAAREPTAPPRPGSTGQDARCKTGEVGASSGTWFDKAAAFAPTTARSGRTLFNEPGTTVARTQRASEQETRHGLGGPIGRQASHCAPLQSTGSCDTLPATAG